MTEILSESQYIALKDPEAFLYTKLAEMPQPFIDTKEPVFNFRKHQQTCAKNRKKRNKKRRRL